MTNFGYRQWGVDLQTDFDQDLIGAPEVFSSIAVPAKLDGIKEDS